MASDAAPISAISAQAYRIPTASPESDGTFEWDSTTLVLVRVEAGGKQGIGYSYTTKAAAGIIEGTLKAAVMGKSVFDLPLCWRSLRQAVRNIGQRGLCGDAISAVDIALWDLKAKLLDLPLVALLGSARDKIEVYGSGGFTSYGPAEIARQIEGWVAQGIAKCKIKIGRDTETDPPRIDAALRALPQGGELFVDANGAYHPRDALRVAHKLADYPVTWFEEPVSSDDIKGLRFLRTQMPPGIAVAAGEYAAMTDDFLGLLEQEAVDTLQIDATRSLGITGFLQAAILAEAYHRPVSAHCAPLLHTPLCCHVQNAVHIEYFWDHARIESMLFDGVPPVEGGHLTPQNSRAGLGVIVKERDAEKYLA